MVVQHNLTAMNSNRMLGVTTSQQAKATEKLSSGYKINRAADDAAGLAISEKMRKQIRGLTQASANAQDGISVVQTAEGALAEVHDMLQRMNELAVKAANGTQSESDRESINAEIKQLITEIDRVSETTKFNETYLLKGDKNSVKGYSYGYQTITSNTAGGVVMTTGANGLTAKISFKASASGAAQNEIINALKNSGINIRVTISIETAAGNTGKVTKTTQFAVSLVGAVADKYTITTTGTPTATKAMFAIKDVTGKTIATITAQGLKPSITAAGVYSTNVVANTVTAAYRAGESHAFYDKDGNRLAENALNKYFTSSISGTSVTSAARSDAPAVYDAVGNKVNLTQMASRVQGTQDIMGKLQVGLHVGADATTNNQITMNIETMSAKGLGISGVRVDTAEDALRAIETVAAALAKVSAQRSDLGAVQNRLEHTINNLDNVVENTTSAESAVRDTDMASMMVQYSNNNILAQAGTSMLAQANQSNQSVLSLLQ